mgnify:CR=1 FL=1
MTPNLIMGGLSDPFCAGNFPVLPEAAADGFDNNCAWMAYPLEVVAARPENSLWVANIEGEGHVPSIDPGIANDIVDDFVKGVLAQNPEFPFAG